MRASKRDFFQQCWIVSDLHEGMRRWHETTGIGPFFYIENLTMENCRYRGRQLGDVRFSVAFANTGPLEIELIVQHNDVPSAFIDSLGLGGVGFHHAGTFPADYDAELEHYLRQGIQISHEATFGGQRFCYLDTRASLGWMVELMDLNEESLAMRKMFSECATGWDGEDPYRQIGMG